MQFSSQLINQWINLIQDHFIIFFSLTYYLLFFFFFIFIGVVLDSRFQIKYRIFFLFLFFYFLIFFLYLININQIDQTNWILLIKDIFWFTLILNLGFIWHICILDWLYQFFRYYEYHYICFIITRISYVTSLFFPLYLLQLILFGYDGIYNGCWIYRLLYYPIRSIVFIELSLSYFIKSFTYYSMFLMGLNQFNYSFKNYFSLNRILLLLISLILSYFVLGIPRLYIVWVILSIWKLGQILNKIYIFHQDKINSEYNDHKDFLFRIRDLLQLELNHQYDSNMSDVWRYYIYLNSPFFFCEFTEFSRYCNTIWNWAHGLTFKHPFLYYPPKILFLVLMRHDMKNHYEWDWETSEDEIVGMMNERCKYDNIQLSEEEFEEIKKILCLRFKKKLRTDNKIKE